MKVKCPTCKKNTGWKDNPFRPFCSERCKLIDLGKWAEEEYKIEGERHHNKSTVHADDTDTGNSNKHKFFIKSV